jgi:cob(I)alamin adenosyltransferase
VKVYTRRGDEGQTDLFGGARVSKDDLQVEAYGAVDELNAFIGVVVAVSEQQDVRARLSEIQAMLFRIGAVLAAVPKARGKGAIDGGAEAEDVAALEQAIDRAETELTPLERFVLPGGTRAAAGLHAARTVCRRAERRMVSLDRADALPAGNLRYVNRLSDLLFVLARLENARAGVADVEWSPRDSK